MAQAYVSYQTGNWDTDSTWAAAWVADTVQTVGSWRRPTVANGYIYECKSRSGDYKTGLSEPTWGTTIGADTTDDAIVWTCRDKYPNQTTAGQTYTISAGHTVTYNVVSTVELGASTINGLESWAINANTQKRFAHVDLTIANGGELRIGTTGAIVDKAYTAILEWNTTADNAKGLVINAGGKFTTAGDPALYGSDFDTTIASANWTSTSTFTTADDMSAKWAAGQIILIHKNALYSNYLTDTFPATIQSISGTSVTIVQSHPGGTFYVGGYINNISRNVKVGQYNATAEPLPITVSGALMTNRPRITDNNTTSSMINLSDTILTSCYRLNTFYKPILTRVVSRYSNVCCYYWIEPTITDGLFMCSSLPVYYGVRKGSSSAIATANTNVIGLSYSLRITGKIYGNQYPLSAFQNREVLIKDADIYSNSMVINGGEGLLFDNCNLFYNGAISAGTTQIADNIKFMGGKIGYDSLDNSKQNTNNMTYYGANFYQMDNVKVQTDFVSRCLSRNTSDFYGRITVSNNNQLLYDDRVYDCFGTVLRKTADGSGSLPNTRSIANDQVCEITTETNCSAINPLLILNPDKHSYYCEADQEKTIRYYFQLDGTASTIVDGDRLASTPVDGITLELSWLDGTTNSSRTVWKSSNHIAPRASASDWSQYLEVTVTPAVTGYINAAVYLMKDIGAGKTLWCDPMGDVRLPQSEFAMQLDLYSAIWGDGETSLTPRADNQYWNITETNPTTVGAYTGITIDHATQTVTLTDNHTMAELFDYHIWNLCDSANYAYSQWLSTIDGTNFTSTYNITVDGCEFDMTGKTLDCGAKDFSLTGGGSWVGMSVTDTDGLLVKITVNNIVSGSRIQLHDVTTDTELVNDVVTGTQYAMDTLYTAANTIRLRLMYVDGTTDAYKWHTQTNTISTTGLTFQAAQEVNQVYLDNAVDGSAVTECSVTGTTIKIYVDDPDNLTTAQRIYNWYQYWLFTEDGIRDQDGTYVTATDTTNYVFDNSMKLVNEDIVNPLTITGANILPVSGPAANVCDVSNGASIIIAADKVVFAPGFAQLENIVTADEVIRATWTNVTVDKETGVFTVYDLNNEVLLQGVLDDDGNLATRTVS